MLAVLSGFAMPSPRIRAGGVPSFPPGDDGAIRSRGNLAQAILRLWQAQLCQLCGIILNARNIEGEQEIVRKAAEEISTDVIAYIPRSGDIQRAEAGGGTVFECLEDSPMRAVYEDLAERVLQLTREENPEENAKGALVC